MVIQGHLFSGQWKADEGLCIFPYDIVGIISEAYKNSDRKHWKSPFSTKPLPFDASFQKPHTCY